MTSFKWRFWVMWASCFRFYIYFLRYSKKNSKAPLRTTGLTPSVHQNFPIPGFILQLQTINPSKCKCSLAGYDFKLVFSTWNPRGLRVGSFLEQDWISDKEKTSWGIGTWGIQDLSPKTDYSNLRSPGISLSFTMLWKVS